MLEVNRDRIKEFVELFINNALFSDLPSEQQAELKDFLTDFLCQLYNKNIQDIISLIEQLEVINPFMIKLALSYGILEEDVVELIRILFMKINEYFYKKGSFELIKNIKRIFDYYGIMASVFQVIYNKEENKYYLKNVETGEVVEAEESEIITPGHIVHKNDYSAAVFADNYETIVIYISMEMYASVNKKMQHPTALLHAYSITKHRSSQVQFYINEQTYDLTLDQFLDFLRYFYLKYLKVKYPSFELNESGLEMWSLFITDSDDYQLAEELLTELLNNQYNSREGLAYYIRLSTKILNNYKFQTQPRTLDEIRDHMYEVNPQLAEAIDNLHDVNEFIHNINITMLYYEQFLSILSTTTVLEQYVKNTLRFLFMFVVFNMISNFDKQVKQSLLKYKRYYLPVYTQFFFSETKKYIIRNDFFRIFIEDKFKTDLKVTLYSLLDIRDKQQIEIYTKQLDMIYEVLDSFNILISSTFNDTLIDLQDNNNIEIFSKMINSVLANDNTLTNYIITQKDNTDILDSVKITIS